MGIHRTGRLRWMPRLGSLVLLAGLAILLAGPASATTGPSFLLRPPRYRISGADIRPYLGRYVQSSTTRAAKIITSQIEVGLQSTGTAQGLLAMYDYDAQGHEQSFIADLYDFHLIGRDLKSQIVTAGVGKPLGTMSLRLVGSSHNLTGTISPPGRSGAYPITYRYLGTPTDLDLPLSDHPATSAPRPVAPKPKPGWGPTAGFLGRYHLVPASGVGSAPSATNSAGIFSVALAATERMARTTGGELTLFKGKIEKKPPPLPGGILKIQAATGNEVVYLTDLRSVGATRLAAVRGGSFLGPVIGSFKATSHAPGTFAAQITARGLPTTSVRLVRYSRNPSP